jgi:hypothetical protein
MMNDDDDDDDESWWVLCLWVVLFLRGRWVFVELAGEERMFCVEWRSAWYLWRNRKGDRR